MTHARSSTKTEEVRCLANQLLAELERVSGVATAAANERAPRRKACALNDSSTDSSPYPPSSLFAKIGCMTQKWEYLVAALDQAGGLKKATDTKPARLIELGTQGREAVGVSLKKGDLVSWPVVLLKRPVDESPRLLASAGGAICADCNGPRLADATNRGPSTGRPAGCRL